MTTTSLSAIEVFACSAVALPNLTVSAKPLLSGLTWMAELHGTFSFACLVMHIVRKRLILAA
jgi:hypothetical protein